MGRAQQRATDYSYLDLDGRSIRTDGDDAASSSLVRFRVDKAAARARRDSSRAEQRGEENRVLGAVPLFVGRIFIFLRGNSESNQSAGFTKCQRHKKEKKKNSPAHYARFHLHLRRLSRDQGFECAVAPPSAEYAHASRAGEGSRRSCRFCAAQLSSCPANEQKTNEKRTVRRWKEGGTNSES